jgi:hypothetical protein
MNKKWKVVLLALITASVLSMALAAQEPPSPESNTSKATAGNFGTDVDNFLSLHSWGDVEIEKSFIYGGFRNSDAFDGYALDLGYARYFGGLYLGAFYEGRIVDEGKSYTEEKTVTTYAYKNGVIEETGHTTTIATDDGRQEPVTENGNPVYYKDRSGDPVHVYDETGASVDDDAGNPLYVPVYVLADESNKPPAISNNIGVLLGIGSMGIKVGFYENLWSTDKYVWYYNGKAQHAEASNITESVNGVETVKTDITGYNKSEGIMTPYLGWGIKLDLGGLVIKPEVSAGLDIKLHEEKYSFAGISAAIKDDAEIPVDSPNVTQNGVPVGAHTTGDYYKDEGYLGLSGKIGAGVDFPVNDGRQFGLGLFYGIAPRIYSRSYKSASGDETVAGIVYDVVNYTQTKVETTGTTKKTVSNASVSEQSYINHTVSPSFWYVNELSESVSLGINGLIDFGFESSSRRGSWTGTTIESYVAADGNLNNSYDSTQINTNYWDNEDFSSFSVTPDIGMGVTWTVKPDRFTLNAGMSVRLPSYTSETRHTLPNEAGFWKYDREYKDGSEQHQVSINDAVGTKTETTVVTERWDPIRAGWNLGGAFSFTPNFVVDMYFHNLSGDLDAPDGSVSVDFAPIRFSLLFSLKY